MSHLEDLVAEFFDWKGYLVKRNIKVGRLAHGGFEMELDIVAYHPHLGHLMHAEPSLDADTWAVRERRFLKKFAAGQKYIFQEVFTWLDRTMPIDQVAILVSHPRGRDTLAGCRLQSVDEFVAEVRGEVLTCGVASRSAIPEQYPLLRTMQLSHSGYHRVVSSPTKAVRAPGRDRAGQSCLCCSAGTPLGGPRQCPVCGHSFRGHGWNGIDAHWRSKHEDVARYEVFLGGLCEGHRLGR